MDDRRERKGEQHDVIRMMTYVFSYKKLLSIRLIKKCTFWFTIVFKKRKRHQCPNMGKSTVLIVENGIQQVCDVEPNHC